MLPHLLATSSANLTTPTSLVGYPPPVVYPRQLQQTFTGMPTKSRKPAIEIPLPGDGFLSAPKLPVKSFKRVNLFNRITQDLGVFAALLHAVSRTP
ncbi:MAG: hypothetical protein VKJ06_04700 [Vampirovibrionales bacterium]|nr:hypothetical protein [Vampirovibrionales bacterium]